MMVEEPDASHHPMLQARLADLYLRLGHMRTNRFMLETHSPYIVQGLLRRIRQTFNREAADPEYQIRPSDISIVYVQPEPEGTRTKVIGVSEDGFLLDQIPDGFLYKQAELRFG
jgi:predicted ATPase